MTPRSCAVIFRGITLDKDMLWLHLRLVRCAIQGNEQLKAALRWFSCISG